MSRGATCDCLHCRSVERVESVKNRKRVEVEAPVAILSVMLRQHYGVWVLGTPLSSSIQHHSHRELTLESISVRRRGTCDSRCQCFEAKLYPEFIILL